MSECPESNGAINGIRALRSVERSTSMYATTSASDSLHTCRSARPRPFASRWTTRTSSNSSARERASANVPSTLALSAMVIRAENGTCVRKCRRRRRTHVSRPASSLYTGTTTSSTTVVAETSSASVLPAVCMASVVIRPRFVGPAPTNLRPAWEFPGNRTRANLGVCLQSSVPSSTGIYQDVSCGRTRTSSRS